jgi:dihydroorotase
MSKLLLHNGTIVTSEKECAGSILIEEDLISEVIFSDKEDYPRHMAKLMTENPDMDIMELDGLHVMAGGIDAHVHFREPGLTHKADFETESRAAAAGGVTSVIDMPNTQPATISEQAIKEKIKLAGGRTVVNIGFHFGATNSNAEDIENSLNGEAPHIVGGIKVFMGSSTGNMLVDENETLNRIFSIKDRPVLVHCEDEATIKANLAKATEKYGDNIPFEEHENIRSRTACIKSSIKALEMAIRNKTRLVLCHISTKEEMEMVRAAKLNNPEIIAETSCNYLWFCNEDYKSYGSRVKCNPSIKKTSDREALRAGLAEGIIDTIGSDHAPHLPSEKDAPYCKAPSGLPSIQQSLPVLVTIAEEEDIPLTRIASVFSEKASDIYGLDRGKLKAGYHADIVIFKKDQEFTVRNVDQYSKCGWTPYEGKTLKGYIQTVFVNGQIILQNGKIKDHIPCGRPLEFR